MQLVKFNPFHDMQRMEQDLDKFWQANWDLIPTFTEATTMDMYEEDGRLVVETSLPNFKKDEVKVTANAGVLEVSAVHKEEEEKKGKRRYLFRESSNKYLRRVALPEGAQDDKTEASFKDGVLKVTMPMAARKEAKLVRVE